MRAEGGERHSFGPAGCSHLKGRGRAPGGRMEGREGRGEREWKRAGRRGGEETKRRKEKWEGGETRREMEGME